MPSGCMDIHDRERACPAAAPTFLHVSSGQQINDRCLHWLLKQQLVGLQRWSTQPAYQIILEWLRSCCVELQHGRRKAWLPWKVQGIVACWGLWLSACWPLPVLCDKGRTAAMHHQGRVHKAKGGMTAALHSGNESLDKEVVQCSPQYLTRFLTPLSHHCHPGPDKGSVSY